MALAKDSRRIRLNITLDKELLADVDSWCEKYGCNRSAFIGIACRSKLDGEMMIQKFPEMLSVASEQLKLDSKKKKKPTQSE